VVDVVRVNNVAVTPTTPTTHTIPSIAANTTIQVTYKLAPAPVGGNVVLLGTDWFGTTGLTASITKPSPAGTMVVYVYGERNVAITTSQVSVSYGSVVMEKVEDRTVTNGYTAYVGAFILREASLPSTATSTLQVNWGSNTNIQITHTRAAFFSNVEQGAIGSSNHPIKSKSSNSLSNNTSAIQLPSTLANSTGDMIILGGYSSSTSGRWDTTAKTPTNFLQAPPVPQVTQANTNDYDYLIAHKSATGAVEQPAIYYSSPLSRHICLGIVLNRAGDNINTEISGANAIAQDMASMSVYPNPANGSLTIIHPLNSKINIVNILGQQVYERVASGTQTVLNTNEIKAKGVVYINITSGGTSSVKKVIINE
jgi:hypothetical protein